MSEKENIFAGHKTVETLPCSTRPSAEFLSKDTLDALYELGGVLRRIHKRMITEGYELADGAIRKKI